MFRMLVNAIIKQTICDYKNLVRGKIEPTRSCNLNEITTFLKSDYCDNLLYDTRISGNDILKYLEKWKTEFDKNNVE